MKMRSSCPATFCRRRAAGLTLVEILVTLSIVALLMTLAVPSFKPLLDRWRVKQGMGALTDALRLARSEAIKRGGNVVLQKLPNNTKGCQLAEGADDWGCGWFVYADMNANGSFEANTNPPDERLQVTELPGGIQVLHRSGASITLDRWGAMDSQGTSFTAWVAGASIDAPTTRTLCISSGGRIHEKDGRQC